MAPSAAFKPWIIFTRPHISMGMSYISESGARTTKPNCFVEAIQCICAAVRPRKHPSELTSSLTSLYGSKIRGPADIGSEVPGENPVVFILEPLHPSQSLEAGEAACWTMLFKYAIIFWADSPRPRSAEGLELDFKRLASLRGYGRWSTSTKKPETRTMSFLKIRWFFWGSIKLWSPYVG